ncbi:hypothetical protein ABKV19_016729 [Rosa sericea]
MHSIHCQPPRLSPSRLPSVSPPRVLSPSVSLGHDSTSLSPPSPCTQCWNPYKSTSGQDFASLTKEPYRKQSLVFDKLNTNRLNPFDIEVFCTKSKPNCNACPMRAECRHYASAFTSARLALPGPEEKSVVSATEDRNTYQNPSEINNGMPLPLPLPHPHRTEQSEGNQQLEASQQSEPKSALGYCEPIIEEPATLELECTQIVEHIEDFYEDPDEIPTIKLNMEQFTQNWQVYMQQNMELQEGEMSKSLVALTPDAAFLPMPKLKNVSRLRTEHQV